MFTQRCSSLTVLLNRYALFTTTHCPNPLSHIGHCKNPVVKTVYGLLKIRLFEHHEFWTAMDLFIIAVILLVGEMYETQMYEMRIYEASNHLLDIW